MSEYNRFIRNFAIIAHIDHGKSTLADRFIDISGALDPREKKAQFLDSMDIERERGITIKSQTVRLSYLTKQNKTYILNLMDTPGHVDFSYEVSRSLYACEGVVLVIDASQGIEAQTLANVYLALGLNLPIISAINKIDLPAANVPQVTAQIQDILGLNAQNIFPVSAKTGEGMHSLIGGIIQVLPPPINLSNLPMQALLVDSWYDPYVGVIAIIRIVQGTLKLKDKITLKATKHTYTIETLGYMEPGKRTPKNELISGEIGFFQGNIKSVSDCFPGDTIVHAQDITTVALEGFNPPTPVVFCGIFPADSSYLEHLKMSLEKLSLNDSSFTYEMMSNDALGVGFRCGFLGLLHLEIIRERLEREYDVPVITTAPTVKYEVVLKNGETILIHNPTDLPEVTTIEAIKEPWVTATVIVPSSVLGSVLRLIESKRGKQVSMNHTGERVFLTYYMPLSDIIYDFYDRLKSVSHGYASFDYEANDMLPGDLVKLTIVLNGEIVAPFSMIVPHSEAESIGRKLCTRLKELIPKQMFKIPIQAAIGGKIVARETVSALRKNVTAKCYGGDITRKRKLLEKQKEGKKRMRQFGKVNLPQSIFLDVLKQNN